MHTGNLIKCLLYFVFSIDAHLVSQEVVAPQNVLKVVDQYFGCASGNDIKITRLLEGHSTLNFCIELSSKRYVLRFNENASVDRFQCELYAMEEASKAGISPIVVQGFPHEKMVLMEYIDGNTMTIEQASQVETCIKITQNLKKTHSTKKNPHHGLPRNEIMEGFYAELLDYPEIHMKTTQAIEIIRKCHNEIVSIPSHYAVNTHNDLNLGNILIEKDRVLFIDWEGTNWEDPFYDLSYFAIFHDYDENMEFILMKNYLDRDPSSEELHRYYLTKKANFARISMSCFFISFVQNKPDVSDEIHLENWKHYIRAFANKCHDNLPVSQFFYNLARAALQEANAVNCQDLSCRQSSE